LTPKQEGVSHILEVGGPSTMAQSLNAIKIDGVISIIGFLGGGADKQSSFLDVLSHVCIVRGIYVGSRVQFEDMVSSTSLFKPCLKIKGNSRLII
jgi:NADPH:quinone reductase-like Zn-dependent oxidoreductase